jgi:hypothetical protein
MALWVRIPTVEESGLDPVQSEFESLRAYMSCLHIQGTRRTGDSAPFRFTGKKDRTFEVEQNARHENPKVRATAAASPWASQRILWELAEDPEPSVREWVARNTSAPNSLLSVMAFNEEHAPIRAFIAWNPNASSDLIERLMEDRDQQVREVAKMVLDSRREV